MAEVTAAEKAATGQIWDEFCDLLKEAGKVVLRPENPTDVTNRMLGYRFLSHLLRSGLESAMDYSNPQFPAFFRLADETKKMLNDNPDNYYMNCVIDGRFDYKITGMRNTIHWLSIGSKGSALDAARMVDTGNIDSTQMSFNADGSFEILVSAEPKPGNWLPLKPTSRMLIVRQTFADRRKERPADLRIECLNPNESDNNMSPERIEAGLRNAALFVRNIGNMTIEWQKRYRELHTNLLPEDDQQRCIDAGGDPNVHYYQSFWKLAPDEALYVHFKDIPDCQTWNLQVSNYWMESLDYRFFPICVNKFNAVYEPDGTVKIVIAHEDPGPRYPNWLRTLGHDQGGMNGRIVGATQFPKEMSARVVKLADLRD